MLIVPDRDVLSVEAKVAPSDVDQLYPDQPSILRFSAFNIRTTPELNGKVSWISPDITEEERTGHVVLHACASQSLTLSLLSSRASRSSPGMPVEAFIQTGSTHGALLLSQAADRSGEEDVSC